ncbi:hypothetical protein BJH93_14695 [Kocuria polaris]|nr:hypothetical protein [Kocuria polaris]
MDLFKCHRASRSFLAPLVSDVSVFICWSPRLIVTVRKGLSVLTTFVRLNPEASFRYRATARAVKMIVKCASTAS